MSDEVKTATDVAGPAAYSWVTYAWVALLSAWGGLVRFLNNVRTRKHDWQEAGIHLFIGLVTSVFVGVITFFLCEAMHVSELITAVLVAGTGHMGAEGIRVFEQGIKLRIFKLFGVVVTIEPSKGEGGEK